MITETEIVANFCAGLCHIKSVSFSKMKKLVLKNIVRSKHSLLTFKVMTMTISVSFCCLFSIGNKLPSSFKEHKLVSVFML